MALYIQCYVHGYVNFSFVQLPMPHDPHGFNLSHTWDESPRRS